MSRSRLATALDGGLTLPPGDVLALRPPAAMDLSALPDGRVVVHHTCRPDRDAWSAQGFRVADEPPDGPLGGPPEDAGTALACLPRAKALARHLIAVAAHAPLAMVDGQREDGVDALWREVRDRVPVEGLAQGHGRLFWFEGGPGVGGAFRDWLLPGPVQVGDGLWSQPGAFSADGPDRGSALLAAALPGRLPARMADLGAGTGVLSLAALAREGVQAIDLVEAERLALDCARLNVTDPRARLRWEDATTAALGPYDGIVMNPPFHAGARSADPALGRAFIAAAARALTPQGQLWMVANRHLPYEAALSDAFRTVSDLGGDAAFKLVHASHPKGARAGVRPAGRAVTRRAAPGRR